jgi:type I restriction enzyme M protein
MIEEDIEFNDEGLIVDCLDGNLLQDTPEERVRQRFIKTLQVDYGYPKNLIKREVPIQSGSSILLDEKDDSPIRADIVVYNSKSAATGKDQGNILFIVECKQPTRLDGYTQLVSYIFNTSAVGGVWTNGKGMDVYRVRRKPQQGLEELLSLPRYKENWEEEERVPRKSDLPRPHNVRFLLSNCHNKLYGRGMENEDFDLAMDMVRILLAKIQDETTTGEYAKFWITNAEYKTKEGRQTAAETVQTLFREYANQYPDVFDKYEKIQVGNDCIAEAVGVLKDWSLAARDDDADEWDLMGATYEQFTHINLKRVQGQFFTNRLVIEMMIKILDPEIGKTALDPAGGSGGFCTAIFRHLRRKIIQSTIPHSAQRDRQLSAIKQNVFLVEKAKRLVKIAKCAMLMTGDGQSGMTHGNSLGDYEDFDPWIRSRCNKNDTTAPAVIATNPPFSGQKTESMITDYSILQNFDFGHSCKMDENGTFVFSKEDGDILQQQAPELLFLERCLDWLAPGGRLGIIMPKGFLDNISYEHYRQWLLRRCILNGVVTLHKDTFQPDTGVRTCILFITKPKEHERIPDDYPIFFAISQRIGQDSKGNSVYVLDANGKSTGELNHDLNEIADAYIRFRNGEEIMTSEYIFTSSRMKIKDHLNINPQHYSPRLNAALEHVLAFDNKEGWATTTLGQLESGISIYMGPRWNSSDIKIDNPSNKTGLIPYLTANNVLELRRFKMKWIDPRLANTEQKNSIKMLKVKQGDILISRSGTVGRVTYATKDLASNYLVSDDLVRVRVKNRKLRAYLVSYLCSETALKLMLLDEYGSVQQHLQPRHIQQLIVPVPDNWDMVSGIVEAGKKFISAMEAMSKADKAIRENGFDELYKRMTYDQPTGLDGD